jgi:hypothetical protein
MPPNEIRIENRGTSTRRAAGALTTKWARSMASGAFVDGAPSNGVVELRQVLLQRPDAFLTTITEGLLAYSSGGSVAPVSDPDPGAADSAKH